MFGSFRETYKLYKGDDELFLRNGWPMKSGKRYFQPGPLPGILIIINLCNPTVIFHSLISLMYFELYIMWFVILCFQLFVSCITYAWTYIFMHNLMSLKNVTIHSLLLRRQSKPTQTNFNCYILILDLLPRLHFFRISNLIRK